MFEALHPPLGLAAEVEDVSKQVDGNVLEGHFHQVGVLDVEILQYLEREGAVVLSGGDCLQDFPEGVDEVGDDELVLLSDGVAVLIVLLAEYPPIDALGNGYLLLLEQTQQGLHQHLAVVL